jgi:CheW-like domain/Histidine kinase-, DNA gyrase B-, and HSP90-like ATPase
VTLWLRHCLGTHPGTPFGRREEVSCRSRSPGRKGLGGRPGIGRWCEASPKAGAQLSDNEIFLLIFEAGFSTAETITDLSGQGVGMDVVRKYVQKMRGRIDIQSEAGRGTTFFIKLSLTLAIIEGLVATVGKNRYILPIFSVTEMFRPESSVLSTVQGRGVMAIVRGRLLPVVRLHARFHREPRSRVLSEGMLVVVESQGRQFCLFMDDLVGKQEVVIKSLGEMFKEVRGACRLRYSRRWAGRFDFGCRWHSAGQAMMGMSGGTAVRQDEGLRLSEREFDYVEPATYRKPISGSGSRKGAR